MPKDATPPENTDAVVALAHIERVLSREVRPLPVPLSPAELRAASRSIGQLIRERRGADAAFAEVRLEHKTQQQAAEAEMVLLGRMLDTETADRPIECITWANMDAGTAETRRTDTGEVLWTRPLTDNERQQDLFGDAPPRPRRGRRSHPAGEGLEK